METKKEKKSKAKAKDEAPKIQEKKEDFVLKPKKATSPWIYFNNEMVAKLKSEKGMDQKEAFAKSAEVWKGLTENEKEVYIAKSKQDEERYQKQVKELSEKGFFTTSDGQKSIDLYVDPKKKYGEDCVVPKKPLSAYLFFTTENVNKIKEQDKTTHPEAMKKCGEIWNTLSPEERAKYDEMHLKDKARYEEQIASLDQKGFFIMQDGSKSSDHKTNLKKRAKKIEAQKEKNNAKKEKKATQDS